jgi:glutamate synthase domain-containing protein 2
MSVLLVVLLVILVVIVIVAVYDLTQKKRAILRNFPVVGHLRYVLERIGPELRQYIVTDNNEERPFSRDQRRWVYATAKAENPYFGFGTDNVIDQPGQIIIKHSAFPLPGDRTGDHQPAVPGAKVLGGWRGRDGAFRPPSMVNVSAMSFGSLSGAAVRALNEGAAHAGYLHNTGEGGIADHHRHGGDLLYQVGTGYFGCRSEHGDFSLPHFLDTVTNAPVKAVEIKLSQGAKPGIGGLLPAAKVTAEIAAARGVPKGVTVASPASHSAFGDVVSLVDFVEQLAEETGLPIGIKAAVGQLDFWSDLAAHMAQTGRGPDFITIDGSEGGTGAGPLVFTDNVAYPLRTAMARVYAAFVAEDLHRDVVFIGGGKLGYPQNAVAAMTLGCDMINVAREAMMAIGCIQAQECHTGHCPTGVATQSRRLARGLDPTSKGVRVANYVAHLRYELLRLAHASGVSHPALIPASAVELNLGHGEAVSLTDRYGLPAQLERHHRTDILAIESLMAAATGVPAADS